MKKPKILFVCEASSLLTGFSNINKEMMNRFYADGYEIAELASYVSTNDPKNDLVPWVVYGVLPENQQENAEYNSDPQNQFGKWKFEETLRDFKPDVVVISRDSHMDDFVVKSPLRSSYKIIWMVIPDSEPITRDQVEILSNVDVVIPAMEYSKKLLEKYGFNRIKIWPEPARPCVDEKLFRPLDKIAIRAKHGVKTNAKITLMVSRNQPRKLFVDLLEAYRLYLDKIKDVKTREENYLYLSTSYPDVGFSFIREIFDLDLGNHVLLNYYCRTCGNFKPMLHRGELAKCDYCNQPSMVFPNTKHGLTRGQLVETYNMADVYVQHCTNEGISLTPSEAKACGVPVIAPNHTTLPEHTKMLYGAGRKFWQNVGDEHLQRFLPDNKGLAILLSDFFSKSQTLRDSMSKMVRQDIEENFTFDRGYSVFKSAVDSLPRESILNLKQLKFDNKIYDFAHPIELVTFAYQDILKRPDDVGSVEFWTKVKDIQLGKKTIGRNQQPYSTDIFIEEIKSAVEREDSEKMGVYLS